MQTIKTWKKLYGHLLRNAPSFWWGISTAFVGIVLLNFSNYSLRHFVDALSAGESDLAWKSLVVIVLSYIAAQVLQEIGYMCQANWNGTWDSLIQLKKKTFRHLQDLDFAFHSNKSSGSIISILKQGESAYVQMGVDFHFRILPIIIEIFVVGYFLLNLSGLISAIFLGTMLIFFTFITWFGYTQNEARKKLRQSHYKVDAVQVENLTNFDTVKFFSQEKTEEKKHIIAIENYRRIERPYVNRYLLLQIVTSVMLGIMMFLCLSVAIRAYFAGIMSVGDIAAIVTLIAVLLPSLLNIANEWRNITKYLTDLEPYFELLETPNSVIDHPIPEKQKNWNTMDSEKSYDIRFSDITFHYPEREPIFENLSLHFEAGKSYGIVGRSGAGKTTLVKLILRFYDLASGKISINGIGINDITKSSLRSKIGIVPQETLLFNDTLRHNIIYGKPDATESEIQEALEKSALSDFVATLPLGLETIVGERGVKLSGGQRQRVGIARVFLEDAPIIIFDEATSHLDSESESLIQSAFWEISKGKTTIVIAHRLSTLRHCDHIIVLDKGKIIEEGTHHDLKSESSGLYHHLLELQKMNEIED